MEENYRKDENEMGRNFFGMSKNLKEEKKYIGLRIYMTFC